MPKKRADHEGSIGQRKDGLWYVALTIGIDLKTGKPKRLFLYGKTQAAVLAKKNQITAAQEAGTFVEPSRVTVGQWLDTWLKEYCEPSVRHTTWQQYEYLIRVHLKPALGRVVLKNLRPERVQALYNAKRKGGRVEAPDRSREVYDILVREGRPLGPRDIAARLGRPLAAVEPLISRMCREGSVRRVGRGQYAPVEPPPAEASAALSARTVHLMHTVLREALNQAIANGLIARNVTESAKLPKYEKPEIQVLDEENQNKLLDAIGSNRLGAAFLLGLATGLRRGELLALRRSDVDMDAGILRVVRGLVEVRTPATEPGQKIKVSLQFQDVKSKTGRRVVPIPDEVLPALRAHLARQAEERLFLGPAYKDQGLLFATEYGTPIWPRSFSRSFDRFIRAAGIDGRISPHGLRHTFATRLLEADEHPKVVQELLGHSSISLTLDTYSHVGMGLKRKAAAKMNETLIRRKKKAAGGGEDQEDKPGK